ncbi:hypothetical protein ACVOZ6_003473 [Escherichia coli]
MSKTARRRERRITANVNRMSHAMTCFVALWPQAGPRSCRELNLPWRKLKRLIARRIEARQWNLELSMCEQSYIRAQNSATTPEERERVHLAALATFPRFTRFIHSLYRNYQQ